MRANNKRVEKTVKKLEDSLEKLDCPQGEAHDCEKSTDGAPQHQFASLVLLVCNGEHKAVQEGKERDPSELINKSCYC